MDSINVDMSTSSSLITPVISRYGRTHKPKLECDYVSTDKKVGAYLKINSETIQYFTNRPNEQKNKFSPKKLEDKGLPRRGRPPKSPTKSPTGECVAKPEVKQEPQDPNSPIEGCEWMVGDLAWARVGGHPFWPCIVALDPIQRIFTKTVKKGRTLISQRWVHVQFFGDNGRRSWLNITSVMCYNGRDAFIQLGDTILAGMRKKEPKQTSAFIIKPAVIQVWEKAVQEAEDLANASREERVAFFTKHFPLEFPSPPHSLTRDELIEKVLSSNKTTPNKKRGRKRKAEHSLSDEDTVKKQIKLEEVKEEASEPLNPLLASTPRTIADRKKRQPLLMQLARTNQSPPTSTAPPSGATPQEQPLSPLNPVVKLYSLKRFMTAETTEIVEEKKPKKKYAKKKCSADFQVFSSKNFDRVTNEHPELSHKEINKFLQRLWNELDDAQKRKYRSRLGNQDKEDSAEEISEDAEIDELEEEMRSKSSSPAPLVKPTTSKRNNFKYLFSGAKSEKVCQLCERPGETVKCRGPCQGYYHQTDCTKYLPVLLTNDTPTQTPGKKRGRPKKSIPESSSGLDNTTVRLKEVIDTKEDEVKVDPIPTESRADESALVVVIEPSLKTVSKPHKGSKDSESCSSEEGEGFRCKDCQEGRSQPCFVCHDYIQKKSSEKKLYRCITAYCGKVYHEECLKPWLQTVWRFNGSDRVLTCPQHTCHTCASDNPGVIKARYSNDKLVRCVRCPTTYHHGNYCLPAGSEILTNTQIICPQHYKPPKKSLIQHVNAAWCFICASGGSLICCDLCPTSFHADCLNISTPPDGSYVCEDCQTGRFPLYGEIIWVKLGTYRWWPAEILYPALIPDNILNLPHVQGEFAVKFFGSHDHYWVNRGRVFLYQDGDTAGKSNYKKSSVDNAFERAVREASEAQQRYVEEKATRDAETRPGMKPPNYVKLKTNRPVGNVRTMDLNVSSLTPCECNPKSDAPCTPDSDCLNRILMVECHPQVCPAGEKCCNQLFEKRQYPPLQPYHTKGRGWGLKTLVPLKKGDFVIEYVGEMIDEEEYKKRLIQMHENNEENYYFLTIDKDRMLDAGPKGNVARFMNHSCQPNCETQKWTVNGDTRVGLFALHDIPADTELVFNYNLESIGSDKKPCMCGAPNCSGFIGVKVSKNQDKDDTKDKKVVKKKKSQVVTKTHEEVCFICDEGGELLLCDGKRCTKAYHQTCLGKKQRPQGYWLCPWHQCNICNKGRVRRCTFCVNSYCHEHSEGNIHLDPVKGLVCSKHDEDKTSDITCNEKGPRSINSLPMDVDEDISESVSTTSTAGSDSSTARVETTNNNVIKSGTPGRRTRRSKSDSCRTENVNWVLQKGIKRKARQASTDAKLICSEKSNEKDGTSKSRFQTTDVEELSLDNASAIHFQEILPSEELTNNQSCAIDVKELTTKEDIQSNMKEDESESVEKVNCFIDSEINLDMVLDSNNKEDELESNVKDKLNGCRDDETKLNKVLESNKKEDESESINKDKPNGYINSETNMNMVLSNKKEDESESINKDKPNGCIDRETNVNVVLVSNKHEHESESIDKDEPNDLRDSETNLDMMQELSKEGDESEPLVKGKPNDLCDSETNLDMVLELSKEEDESELLSKVGLNGCDNERNMSLLPDVLGVKEVIRNEYNCAENAVTDLNNIDKKQATDSGDITHQIHSEQSCTGGVDILTIGDNIAEIPEKTNIDQEESLHRKDISFNHILSTEETNETGSVDNIFEDIEQQENSEQPCTNTKLMTNVSKPSEFSEKNHIHKEAVIANELSVKEETKNAQNISVEKPSRDSNPENKTNGWEDLEANTAVINEAKIDTDNILDKEGGNQNSRINSLPTILGVENAEDFELSYTEQMDEKLYKGINNSESSLEMKLTDCVSSENSENEQLSSKRSELVNCIEQSNAMEVA